MAINAPNPQPWPIQSTRQVYAGDMNSQVRNAVAFLTQPPAFQGQQATSQVVPNSGTTNITLDNPIFDNYLGQNDNTFAKYIVQTGTGGIWLAHGAVAYSVSADTSNYASDLNNNGTIVQGCVFPGSDEPIPLVADLLNMTPGQYIALAGSQGSAGNQNTLVGTGQYSYLNLRWVATATGSPILTVPSLSTWTNGQLCTAANFNSNIFDSVGLLSYPPYFRAQQTSTQIVPTGTQTTITNLSASLDNYSSFASNKWTCQLPGTYLVGWQVGFTGTSAANYSASLSTVISSSPAIYASGAVLGSTSTAVGGIRTIRFSSGDTVQLSGFQTTGGGSSTLTGAYTRFFTLWTSA